DEGWSRRVPGVADSDCAAGQLSHFHTAAARVADRALAPARGQLTSRDAVFDRHLSSQDEGEAHVATTRARAAMNACTAQPNRSDACADARAEGVAEGVAKG